MEQECSLNEPETASFAYPGQGTGVGGYILGWIFSLGIIAFAIACYALKPFIPIVGEIIYRVFHGPVVELKEN